MKYGRKANLSTKSCSEISELEDNLRNCLECKKLLEIREVAKKLPSNLWKALGRCGGGGGGGGLETRCIMENAQVTNFF